jgi:predicted dehydrogenase
MRKIIKWGILGPGKIAHKFAEGLKHAGNSELFAIGSRDYSKAQEFGNQYNAKRIYGSYQDLVNDPEVDIVYIATPHNLHFEHTMFCLENGKSVLCEKPFAVNEKEVSQMIKKAAEKNLFLMEALWSRFLPHIIKAKELIDKDAIGELKFMKSDFGFNSPYNPDSRIFSRQLIGGSLMDVGIYPVSLSMFLLGIPHKIVASAGMGPTEVDHSCSMCFSYGKDLISVLYSSVVARTDVTAEIHGTKGKIVFSEQWFRPVPFYMIDEYGNRRDYNFDFKGNGYNYEAEEAAKCLLAGKTQSDLMSWNDSLNLIKLLDEVRRQCNIFYPDHD